MNQRAIEQQMKNLSAAFDDIENGIQPQRQTPGEQGDDPFATQKAMENILGKLSSIEGFDYENRDYSELKANAEFNQNTRTVDQFDVDQRLANIYANPALYQDTYVEGEMSQDYVPQPEPVERVYAMESYAPSGIKKPTTPWSILSEDVKGLKNVKKYSIQNSYNNQVIIEGIMMQEAAMALLNVLNEGGTLTNPKVLGIISYGIQYTKILENAIKLIKERQLVLNESRYSDAITLDEQIKQSKSSASELKNAIIEYITKGGFL